MAVLAEGPSDAILLPSLIREVTLQQDLQFQVAPGLAGVSRQQAEELDLEAPRIAFLLDGDAAGNRHRRRLKTAGIDDDNIIQLGDGLVIEDLLDPQVYLDAINEELRRSFGNTYKLTLPEIPLIERS